MTTPSVSIVASVKEFLEHVEQDLASSSHGSFTLFRGEQDATWKRVPGIARNPFRPGSDCCTDPDSQDDRSKERRLLIVFRDHAPAHLPVWVWSGSDAHVRWKQLVIAQHYRLPTRLMDWSSNPLVALFFAVEGETLICSCSESCAVRHPDGEHYSSVSYVTKVETTSVESLARRNPEPPVYVGALKETGNTQGEVAFVRPPDIDGRIAAQSSFFSVSRDPGTPIGADGVVLINPKKRAEILAELNRYGINRKSLFPGLDGLAEHLKWEHHNWSA